MERRIKPKVWDNGSCRTDENQEVISKPQQSDDKPEREWEGKPKVLFNERTTRGK
jgi:hypothetical protein